MKLKKSVIVLSALMSSIIFSCATPSATAPVASELSNNSQSVYGDNTASGQSDKTYPSSAPTASASSASTLAPVYPVATPSAAPSTAPTNGAGIAAGVTVAPSPTNEESKTKDNFFQDYGMNPFVSTQTDKLSTFSIDVDTASYTWLRKSITNNILVSPDSVRTEEYINFFDYNYPKPENATFSVNNEVITSNTSDKNTRIVRFGIQGKDIDNTQRKSANLTFVIDISGSMNQENRLGLVKQSLELLVDQLNKDDKVSIVVFGSTARTVLEATGIDNKKTILTAIDNLETEGATNTEAGLLLGYSLAEKNFKAGSINRLVLCSDGVANVGETGPDAILKKIKSESESGINLSTVGFGMGNYNDVLMEKLADQGDGNYAYVDTIKEANRIFVQNLTGTLQVIAKDTKIQVEFNPDIVKEYRLIGYENRNIADSDFRNDQVDAGEVGAKQSVTALYEIKLNEGKTSGKIAGISLRYKDVDQANNVFEINKSVNLEDTKDFNNASDASKLAVTVAEYAEILKNGYWSTQFSLKDVLNQATQIDNNLGKPEKVDEFVSLVQKTINLKGNQQ